MAFVTKIKVAVAECVSSPSLHALGTTVSLLPLDESGSFGAMREDFSLFPFKRWIWGWRDSTADRVLTLCTTKLFAPGTPYDLPEYRARF